MKIVKNIPILGNTRILVQLNGTEEAIMQTALLEALHLMKKNIHQHESMGLDLTRPNERYQTLKELASSIRGDK